MTPSSSSRGSPQSPRSNESRRRSPNWAHAEKIELAHQQPGRVVQMDHLIVSRLVRELFAQDSPPLNPHQLVILQRYYNAMQRRGKKQDTRILVLRAKRGLQRIANIRKELQRAFDAKCRQTRVELNNSRNAVCNTPSDRPFELQVREDLQNVEPFKKLMLSPQLIEIIVKILHPSEDFVCAVDNVTDSVPPAQVEHVQWNNTYRWAIDVKGEPTEYSPATWTFYSPAVCALSLVVALHNRGMVCIEQFKEMIDR